LSRSALKPESACFCARTAMLRSRTGWRPYPIKSGRIPTAASHTKAVGNTL
jgi:hypothetical protein